MAQEIDVRVNVESAAATGAMAGFAASVTSAGIALVQAGIDAAIQAIGDSVSLASDKAEAASKVNVLYAESADQIHAASENAAETVGLSSGAYLEAAGNLGNLLKNFDLSADAAAGMSQDMIQLAADVGSFNNADPSQVIEAMGAALRGESEPMRRFGVLIDEAAIAAKGLELGVDASKGAVDQAGRAQAIYALMLEQTSAAQGDFARTADGLANSQRIAGARMEDAMTRIGEAIMPLVQTLLPLLADAIIWIVDGIGGLLESIGDWVDDNQELMQQLGGLVKILVDGLGWALGLVMDIVGELGYRLGALIGIVIDVLGAIIDFGDAVIRALSGDFAGAAEAAERGLDRIGSFAENVQRVMGDTARRAADEQVALAAQQAAAWDEATATGIKSAEETSENFARVAAAGGEAIGLNAATGTASGLEAGASYVDQAAGALGELIPENLAEGQQEAVRIANQTPGEIADGLRSRRDAWKSAMDQLKDDMQSSMDRTKEIARLEAALTGRKIQEGLESTDPIVRAQAEHTANLIEARLADLRGIGLEAGEDAGEGLADGLGNMRRRVSTAADQLAGIVRGRLELNSPAKEGPWSTWDPIAGMRRNAERIVGAFVDPFSRMAPITPELALAGGGTLGGSSQGAPTIIIQTGVGDPVAIGQEVDRVLAAYYRASGSGDQVAH